MVRIGEIIIAAWPGSKFFNYSNRIVFFLSLSFFITSTIRASEFDRNFAVRLLGNNACVIPPQEPVTIVAQGVDGPEDIVPSQGDYPPGFFVSNFDSLKIYHISPDGTEVTVFSEGTVRPATLTFVPDEFTGNGKRMMFLTQFDEGPLWQVDPDGSQKLVSQFPAGQVKALTYIPQNFGGPASGKLLYTDLSPEGTIAGAILSIDRNGNFEKFISRVGFPPWSLTPAPGNFGVYSDLFFTSVPIAINSAEIFAIDVRSKQKHHFVDVPLLANQDGLRHVVFSPTGWASTISSEFDDETLLLVSKERNEISMYDHRRRLVSTLTGHHTTLAFTPRGIAFINDDIIFADLNAGRILKANINAFTPVDCDNNGLGDICEIDAGLADDCNENGILDHCEITANASLDCNNNNILDFCDVRDGRFEDHDGYGVPDICETTIYVDQNATGADDGTSWDNAFKNLQMALSHVRTVNENPVQIWVANGIYTPAPPNGFRDVSFELVNNVALYGGFASGETQFLQRNPKVNQTILSGDLNRDDDKGGDNCENSFHVLQSIDIDSFYILDGFTITGGNANLSYDTGWGGGLKLSNKTPPSVEIEIQPIISDCLFMNNKANYGGAVYYENFRNINNPIFLNCTFEKNIAKIQGGAAHIAVGTLRFEQCKFIQNHAASGGGIALEVQGRTYISRCMLTENSADFQSGGIYSEGGNVTLDNCVIRDNYSVHEGSGIYTTGFGYTQIKNCSIYNNQGETNTGAGIYNDERGFTEIQQSILWNNIADTVDVESAQIHNEGTLNIEYSTVEGWTGLFGGVGNTGNDPLFSDPFGPDGEIGTGDEDLRLSPGSPAINTGIPYYKAFPDETDLDGHARVLCDTIDRGAYEFGIGDMNCNQVVDLLDYLFWNFCFTGPGAPSNEWDCTPFDFDGDKDVDLYDAAQFMNTLDQH